MFKPKRPLGVDCKQLWQPGDSDDEEEESDGTPKRVQPSAIASTVLPTILHLIPRLKLNNAPDDIAAAAKELVDVTHTTVSAYAYTQMHLRMLHTYGCWLDVEAEWVERDIIPSERALRGAHAA